jgi:RNA polymerase sigma-70 factor (ECF subfamily)
MRYDDDVKLVNAVLDGDKDAFAFLVDRYQGAVYAYCLNQVSSEEDAKDTTQEVLLKAYLNLGQLKTPHAFRSWLYTIASNECRMWHRKHQAHEPLEAAAEPATPTHGSDLETRLTVKEEIDALPESQRLVILMHYFSGFTLKEIGEFLGTSREAIKVRLFRARQKLEMRLKSTFEEYFGSSSKPNFCIPILDKIASLPKPKPSGSNTPVSKAHWLAPLPLATILSVMLLGGLSGLFPTGTDSGASQAEAINVSLLDADPVLEVAQANIDADPVIEVTQANPPKKQIDVPAKQVEPGEQKAQRVEPGEQKDVGDKTSTTSAQVIGKGRIDDIVTSLDGNQFALLTPFGLELHHPDGNQPPITVDTAGEIKSPTFSQDGRFLVWNSDEQLKVWDVEKKEIVATHSFDSLKSTFLFHIGVEFVTELDNKVVSDDLRSIFAEHDFQLENVFFPRGSPRWHITDRTTRHIFDIREAGDKLSVYILHNRRWLDRLDVALHPTMKEVALALPWQGLNVVFIDPISGEQLRSFKRSHLQDPPVEAIQYSPDGEQLVIFEFDKFHSTGPKPPPPRFVFLNPRNGKVLHKFDLQDNNPELTFAYSPRGEWFAFRAWREQRVDVIDTTDWLVKKTFKVGDGILRGVSIFSPDPKLSVTFSPDGRYLALGDAVWDFQTGESIYMGESRRISQFLDDTHLLISDKASVKMVDVMANRSAERVMLQQGVFSGGAYFLSDDDTILVQGAHPSLWKASTGRIVERDIFAKYFDMRFSAISPISPHVASATANAIVIWDAIEREVVHRIPLGRRTPFVLALSPDGSQLAVGEDAYTTSLWNISAKRELHQFVNKEKPSNKKTSIFGGKGAPGAPSFARMVSALAFSPDGNQLACGVFNAIWLRDVKTGNLSQKLAVHINSEGKTVKPHKTLDMPNSPMFLRFSKDGKRLFAGLMSGHFVAFDIASGQVVKTLLSDYRPRKIPHFEFPIPVDLNPDTTLMAVGRSDHVIELIDTQTWERVAAFSGHRAEIRSVDFSHDGTKLLSTSSDGTMRIWEIDDL